MLPLVTRSNWILQATEPVAPVAPAAPDAAAKPAAQAPMPTYDLILMMLAIFVIMWLIVFRPESKRRKEREAKIRGAKKGDQVVTNGGILGKVMKVEEKYLLVQVDKDKDVRVRVLKSGIYEVLPAGADEAAPTPAAEVAEK
jgi:preprotein translocase subunit YajC